MGENLDSLAARWIRENFGPTEEQKLSAIERIDEIVRSDPDPFPALDALVRWTKGDEDLLASFGAGPLENLLGDRPDLAVQVAERCRVDPFWRYAAGIVWLSRDRWMLMPPGLQEHIDEPWTEQPPPARPRKAKRESKRNKQRGRPRG